MKRLSIIPHAVLAVTPLTRVTAQEAVGSAARRIRTLVKSALQQLRQPEVVATVLMILLGMLLLLLVADDSRCPEALSSDGGGRSMPPRAAAT